MTYKKGEFKMKKVLVVLLALAMVFAAVACGKTEAKVDPNAKDAGVLKFAEYIAAEEGAEVTIEGFITARVDGLSWGNCNLMIQDGDGAYYVYRMPATADDWDKLQIGQKVKITGIRTAWSGENEIKEATATYEIVEGKYEFEAADVTAKLASDDLINYQNMKVAVKGAKVTAAALYKWDGSGAQGDDLYLGLSVDGKDYVFVVESDLCGADTETYKAVEALAEGATIDIEGYMYWYNGPQMWIEKVTTK